MNAMTYDPLEYKGPPAELMRKLKRSATLHEWYFAPSFLHEERIPKNDSKLLFVGYHSLFAFDYPYMWYYLKTKHGLHARAFSDKFVFAVPGLADYLAKNFGSIEGSREICRKLMNIDQTLVVFPGGAMEAMHPKNKAHVVNWAGRDGFVRMALEYGYTIVPFAVVGVDDQWDYIMDGQQLADSFVGKLLKKTKILERDDLFPPIFKTLLPRPNRHFYGFGSPVKLPKVAADKQDDNVVQKYKTQIQHDVENLLLELQQKREKTPDTRLFLPFFTKSR